MNDVYKYLIKNSLNDNNIRFDGYSVINWQDFFQFCYRQGILGVVFDYLVRTNTSIPQKILFEWLALVGVIKKQNYIVNKRLIDITKWFESRGLRSVVLKGQANALMYPLPDLRSPGDIDIWVDAPKIKVIKMVLDEFPKAHYSIHHIKMPVFNDVSIEVHYRPIYMVNWFVDRRLQRHVRTIQDNQFSNKIKIEGAEVGTLKKEFNIVYQLLHMYAHFFSTRNNFKQFIDYYYLLKMGFSDLERRRIVELVKELKVIKYAKGIMWVMKEYLGLDEKFLYVLPDKIIGETIICESMKYGTFSKNRFIYTLQRFTTNIDLLRFFPSQVLISPMFFVAHQFWKIKTKIELRWY